MGRICIGVHRRSSAAAFKAFAIVVAASLSLAPAPARAERVTIHRDNFGVPSIYAETIEGAAFGLGYAQAEDRLEDLLENYLRATGRAAEAFGEARLADDIRNRRWRHGADARAGYAALSPRTRSLSEAFIHGVALYMNQHPARVPDWAPAIEPWMVAALARHWVFQAVDAQFAAELAGAGIRYDAPPPPAGSPWVIGPGLSEAGAAIACIDLQGVYEDAARPYEARMYGGAVRFAGFGVVGLPLLHVGHNANVAVALAPGGPDTADVYLDRLNPDNANQYQDDGRWRPLRTVTEAIGVAVDGRVEWREFEMRYTHRGPVIAERDGIATSLATPYYDQNGAIDQLYAMATARDLAELKRALAAMQLGPMGVMAATAAGDIYYVRAGRTPVRPAGYDFSRPVPGDRRETAWEGLHGLEDLVQTENPDQGAMQNAGVAPGAMMRDSPMRPEDYASYLYHAGREAPHPAAATILDTLLEGRAFSIQRAAELAMSVQVHGVGPWRRRLQSAWDGLKIDINEDLDLTVLRALVTGWDGRAAADSTGATAYAAWREALGGSANGPPPPELSDEGVIAALRRAKGKLERDRGGIEVPWGQWRRVGRPGGAGPYPAGGGARGSVMATPRVAAYPANAQGARTATGGQIAAMVVLMSDPPQSWTYGALGQSDDPASVHYDDQTRLLFAPRLMKPSYFLDVEGLAPFVTAATVLEY